MKMTPTVRRTTSLDVDAENRLISIVAGGQTTSFAYDGDGNLVKKINPDTTKTIYVGDL